MDNIEDLLPCINKFKESIRIMFIVFYNNIKNIRILSTLKHNIKALLIKTYDYSSTKYIVYKNLLKYRYVCSKIYFNNILNNIYTIFHGKKNKQK